MFSSEALFANLPHSLISKALRYLKMKINCLRKIKECFSLTPRIGIKACVVMIPLLGVTWHSVSSRLYMKLSFTSSPYSTLLKSVFAGNSQNYSISIIILLSNQVRHHYNDHMIIFWSFENINAVSYAREGRLLFQL